MPHFDRNGFDTKLTGQFRDYKEKSRKGRGAEILRRHSATCQRRCDVIT